MSLDKQFKETLYNIKEKTDVKEFLEYLKTTQYSPVACEFDYCIIQIEDITKVFKDKDYVGHIDIKIDQSCSKIYNPIIWWMFDGNEHCNIYDWINLRYSVLKQAWLNEEQKQNVINKFGKNIKEKCFDMLDKLNENKISEYTMYKICEPLSCGYALFDQAAFAKPPKYIDNFDKLIRYLKNIANEGEEVQQGIWFMNNNKNRNFDIFRDEYWVYEDGTNWEVWAQTQKSLIEYIKVTLNYCEMYANDHKSNSDQQALEKVYKVLKELTK